MGGVLAGPLEGLWFGLHWGSPPSAARRSHRRPLALHRGAWLLGGGGRGPALLGGEPGLLLLLRIGRRAPLGRLPLPLLGGPLLRLARRGLVGGACGGGGRALLLGRGLLLALLRALALRRPPLASRRPARAPSLRRGGPGLARGALPGWRALLLGAGAGRVGRSLGRGLAL